MIVTVVKIASSDINQNTEKLHAEPQDTLQSGTSYFPFLLLSLKLFYPDPRVSPRSLPSYPSYFTLPASIVLAENLFKKLLKQVDLSYAMFGKA